MLLKTFFSQVIIRSYRIHVTFFASEEDQSNLSDNFAIDFLGILKLNFDLYFLKQSQEFVETITRSKGGGNRKSNNSSGNNNTKSQKRGSDVKSALFVEGSFLFGWHLPSHTQNLGANDKKKLFYFVKIPFLLLLTT